VCFPTGMARNSTGTIYLGILLIFSYRNIDTSKLNKYFVFIFLFGFMIVFPAINAFRRSNWSEVNIIQIFENTVDDISANYASGDYDAFSVIGDTMQYVKANGLSFGKQLLGAIFFFVPRSIWKTKPYGSGQTIFEWMGASYTNISCPIMAEGYINFGIFGVILFAFLCGVIVKVVDKKYWIMVRKCDCLNYDCLIMLYPFLIPSFFFMLRGDLMSTWAYSFAYIIVFCFLDKLNKCVFRK
jgi:oligosaccharide repeat unit polymerase